MVARLALALCALSALGCTKTKLSIDVVVTRDEAGGAHVAIYPREPERPCTCSSAEWPQPGACVTIEPYLECTCEPFPGTCIESVRLTQAGTTILEPDFTNYNGGIFFDLPDPSATDLTVVLEGCDVDPLVVPLLAEQAPTPIITDIAITGGNVVVGWQVEGTGTGMLVSYDATTHALCHDATFDSTSEMPLGTQEALPLRLESLLEGTPVVATIGEARVWSGTTMHLADPAFVPISRGDGSYTLPPATDEAAVVTIDDVEHPGRAVITSITFVAGQPDVDATVSIAADQLVMGTYGEETLGTFRIDFGPETDRITWQYPDGNTYFADVAHIAPADGLGLGVPERDAYTLAIPASTLTLTYGPATIAFELAATWDLGVIARPTE
jgi:hypothetical protein